MISFDTNLLLYARMDGHRFHAKALAFLLELDDNPDVVVSEWVLVEYYVALRNPVIVDPPLDALEAVTECERIRNHPRWRCVESVSGVMDAVWSAAKEPGFGRRRIFDLRLGETLLRSGVTEFATANVRDFRGVAFQRVWNPVE